MTFEEFKTHFEKFAKVDSDEKRAILESQYQRHLLHIEDQNYFEPLDISSQTSITDHYHQKLSNFFGFEKINENQFYFLAKPSFEPENLLIIEKSANKYFLLLTKLNKNYWSVLSTDNKIDKIEKTTIKTEIKTEIGDKIFSLLSQIIIEARQPKAQTWTLDGTVFWLSQRIGSNQKIVSKHSPGIESKSGKTINILATLAENIGNLNESLMLKVENQIDDLLN